MTSPASDSLAEIVARLDARVRRVDEERWLSSRYADAAQRRALIVLYAFYFELARVRVAVTDQTLGQIRFQWWRDALAELQAGEIRQHDVVLALADCAAKGALHLPDLVELVAKHEQAFLSNDRDLEPEDKLLETAIKVLIPQDELGLSDIAMDWAALRRGESHAFDRRLVPVKSVVRPAVAHLRLRRPWGRGQKPGPFARRVCIFWAVVSGQI